MKLHLPAWMLAVADNCAVITRSRPRAVRYAGDLHLDVVPDETRAAKAGYLYLLHGKPGEWRDCFRLPKSARGEWPGALPELRELQRRAGPPRPRRLDLPAPIRLGRVFSSGYVLCEIVDLELPVGQRDLLGATPTQRLTIVSLVGWALGQLGGLTLQVRSLEHGGREIWLLEPQAIEVDFLAKPNGAFLPPKEPLAEAPPRPVTPVTVAPMPAPAHPDPLDPALLQEVWPERPAAFSRPSLPSTQLPPPAPCDRTFRLSFAELDYANEAVAFSLSGRKYEWRCAMAVSTMQPIRQELAELLPSGCLVTEAAEGCVRKVEWLEALASAFEKHQRRRRERAVEKVKTRRTWQSWADTRQELEEAGVELPASELEALMTPELGFSKRAQALRALYRLHDPSCPTLHWGDEALLLSIKPDWLVWEVMREDHATYLFRPPAAARDELLEVLAEESPRQRILQDAELRRRLGFVARVRHFDGAEALERWWRDLCDQLQLRERPSMGEAS